MKDMRGFRLTSSYEAGADRARHRTKLFRYAAGTASSVSLADVAATCITAVPFLSISAILTRLGRLSCAAQAAGRKSAKAPEEASGSAKKWIDDWQQGQARL